MLCHESISRVLAISEYLYSRTFDRIKYDDNDTDGGGNAGLHHTTLYSAAVRCQIAATGRCIGYSITVSPPSHLATHKTMLSSSKQAHWTLIFKKLRVYCCFGQWITWLLPVTVECPTQRQRRAYPLDGGVVLLLNGSNWRTRYVAVSRRHGRRRADAGVVYTAVSESRNVPPWTPLLIREAGADVWRRP